MAAGTCTVSTDPTMLKALAQQLSPFVCRPGKHGTPIVCLPEYATPVYDIEPQCSTNTTAASCGSVKWHDQALCKWTAGGGPHAA